MKRRLAWAALCLILAMDQAQAGEVDEVRGEVDHVVQGAGALERDYLKAARFEQRHALTARLNDGELLYNRGDYPRAAIILLDVVENPEARNQPLYREALWLLGDSLFRMRNANGAGAAFEELARVGDADQRSRAIGRLVELALVTGDEERAIRALALARSVLNTAADPTLLYAVGKYEFRRGDARVAVGLFDQVPLAHAYGWRARYFAAAAALKAGQGDDAYTRFRRLLDDATRGPAAAEAPAEAFADEDRQVLDLTRLAVARMLYERGDLDTAMSTYAELPRTSKVFDQGLFESVWIEVKRGDYERALRKLEIQLIAQPDVVTGHEARLLQGKLLLMQGRYDDANQAFEALLHEFGPVQDEMRGTVITHGDRLDRHLNEVVGRDIDDFDPNSFLPAKAARFAGRDPQTERALNLVGDLGLQRRDVEEARVMADEVETALEAGSRIKIFPRLHEGWLRAFEFQGRGVAARARLNDRAATGVRGNAAYDQLRAEREVWAARFREVPRSVVALRDRGSKALDEMQRIDKVAYRLELDVRSIEAQLTAIDRYLADTLQVSEQVLSELPARRQSDKERVEALALREELKRLMRDISQERIRIGGADAAYREDERIRRELLLALKAEADWLRGHGASPDPAMLARLDEADAQIGAFFAEAAKLVDERVAVLRRALEAERRNITEYDNELSSFRDETESIGGTIAARTFLTVLDRIGAVVLEADVGLIDVAWKQKQDKSDDIGRILDRQTADLGDLERQYQELRRD